MQRILIFSLNYVPFIGGAEVAIEEITKRLPNDYEFHILVPHYDSRLPKEEQVNRVMVHRFGLARPGATISDQSTWPLKLNKYWYQFRAAAYAERLHRRYHFDLMWGMMAHATGIPAGMFKKRHPDIPYLLTLQEGDPPAYIERIMKPVWPLFKAGFTSADMLQTISTFLMDWGRRMGFAGSGIVIPNGVDTKHFATPVDTQALARMKEHLGKKEGDVYLVTTSRLVHKNAVDDVICALPLLPESVSFLIYGLGPEEVPLRTLAKELGVEHRVRFMGQIGHEEMPAMLRACDIFVRPSRSEGMGNSFIEAMAAGIPVIATQEGGIKDFLFDAVRDRDREATGWAVDVDSPKQITKAVEIIRGDAGATDKTIFRARDMVLKDYDWDHIATRMRNEVFEPLLTTRSS